MEDINQEDCIKAGMVVLESLTAKGMTYEQQLFMTCSMLAILKASYFDGGSYELLEKDHRTRADAEVKSLFGSEE